MKYNSLFIFSLILSISIITSCSKDEAIISNTDLITQNDWKLLNLTIGADCEKDDFHSFYRDGKYRENLGADWCPGDDEGDRGTWAFNTTETFLTIQLENFDPPVVIESEIIELSAEKLILNIDSEEIHFVPVD